MVICIIISLILSFKCFLWDNNNDTNKIDENINLKFHYTRVNLIRHDDLILFSLSKFHIINVSLPHFYDKKEILHKVSRTWYAL